MMPLTFTQKLLIVALMQGTSYWVHVSSFPLSWKISSTNTSLKEFNSLPRSPVFFPARGTLSLSSVAPSALFHARAPLPGCGLLLRARLRWLSQTWKFFCFFFLFNLFVFVIILRVWPDYRPFRVFGPLAQTWDKSRANQSDSFEYLPP